MGRISFVWDAMTCASSFDYFHCFLYLIWLLYVSVAFLHKGFLTSPVKMAAESKQSIIRLDEYVQQRKQYRIDLIKTLVLYSPIYEEQICTYIMEYCCLDDHILIPDNTEQHAKFWKYWAVVQKGSKIQYSNAQDVKLNKNGLKLIQQGAIVSNVGYMPSPSARLIIECEFRFRNDTDSLTFSTRSNGKRTNVVRAQYGQVEGDCARICQHENSWDSPRIEIGAWDTFPRQQWMNIPDPQPGEMVSVQMVDDGQNIDFRCSFGGTTYAIHQKLKLNEKMCKIALFNGELRGNVVNVTMLRVSVLSSPKTVKPTYNDADVQPEIMIDDKKR